MAHPIISIGSTGPEVKAAQEALTKRGYLLGPIDGLFGPLTRNAVLRYQTDRTTDATPPAVLPPPHLHTFNVPLHVDGIVGPNTWGRLDPPEIKKEFDAARLCAALPAHPEIIWGARVRSWPRRWPLRAAYRGGGEGFPDGFRDSCGRHRRPEDLAGSP